MSMSPDDLPPRTPDRDSWPDDDLRQRFAAERAHDVPRIPPLARILAPRRTVRGARWLQARLALGAVAILVIVVGVWRRTGAERPATAFVLVPGELRVPTDFLLEMSSGLSAHAAEVPSIGAIDWYPLHQQEMMR